MRAPQLVHRLRGPPGRQLDATQQQVHRRIVRVGGGRSLGGGAGAVHIVATEGFLGFRHQGRGVGRAAPAAGRRSRIEQHDQARALEPEQRLRDVEVRAAQRGGDLAQITVSVDQRQHFPFGWQQVEVAAGGRGRVRRDHPEVRHALLDAGPFVDAPRPFHQERLGRDADGGFGEHVGERSFGEGEVSFAPAHHLEHHFFHLKAHLTLQLARCNRAERHEDLTEPARIPLASLHVAGALQIGLGDLAAAQQQPAQRVRDCCGFRRTSRRRCRSRSCPRCGAARR